ncbi:UmuC (plasmid) [Legionella adelaidensis]|uniref:UmuC n=1 Tax=Legionella adelaidensis TaxID=45056 RepID=A0A0W0R0H3_9GAMM|nr:Y-family DNA polymerase [Legionella adelaidensis]KTC64538.1 UmuC [Legionella adelaidensis]VEH85905.1 UmuC [Legionella adelaidensis]
MFALIDCNNFYANCERLFRPDLRESPIIVLSNNDGCVVARSNEAKALGIKMGVPYFEVKGVCKENNVHVFSSNYTLYGDLSERVMSVIQDNWNETEIYSIDEAFLNLSTLPSLDRESFCWDLQKTILRYTGIPTSIGIGSTKTLAKVANHLAKKKFKIPVFHLQESVQSKWLSQVKVGDIWGVGRKWENKLNNLGFYTAEDLRNANPHLIRKIFNVQLLRTLIELKGIVCFEREEPDPKKSIMSSCSFGTLPSEYKEIKEAISHHCATAWNKMRKQHLVAQHLSIFIRSNPFRKDLRQYSNGIGFRLVNATDDIRALTKAALFCLDKIYRAGIRYYKSGVLLSDLIDKRFEQKDLFQQPSNSHLQHGDKLMALIDGINKKYGPRTLRLAAEGLNKEWSMKRQLKSPNYTTQWTELPIVYAH